MLLPACQQHIARRRPLGFTLTGNAESFVLLANRQLIDISHFHSCAKQCSFLISKEQTHFLSLNHFVTWVHPARHDQQCTLWTIWRACPGILNFRPKKPNVDVERFYWQIGSMNILIQKHTSTRQKIRIFWKIAITFLTRAQNPFNYSKRFIIILEINEGKLVHNYGNFNYKYMYFLKKCIFLRIFI